MISFRVENQAVADEAPDLLAQSGVKVGMVLRVETPVEWVAPCLAHFDFPTLLGTAIVVKGQGLDPAAPARLGTAQERIAASGRPIVLAADGAIRETTVPLLRAAGAGTVVLGSLAFGTADLDARMRWLRGL